MIPEYILMELKTAKIAIMPKLLKMHRWWWHRP